MYEIPAKFKWKEIDLMNRYNANNFIQIHTVSRKYF